MKYLLIIIAVLVAGCTESELGTPFTSVADCCTVDDLCSDSPCYVDGQKYIRVTDGNGGVVWKAH